ncbi:MAG: tRNA (adenosine(37)-N6)-threonylcarbamoyltransferase complex dimerization subunit type 1 TsaB [Lachnospiraceae bacterium]|nr:tRNA (adenosine(37)-N6)-threonylcarbamoyltransferase complex dimerization subunit type 1 TsaB [Lachnospiraceae bacterium]
MKIVALDSSGLVASAAIVEDDVVIAEYSTQFKKTHSQTLLPMLAEITKMTETDLNSVDAIAISAGPGSFTGLRIGSAMAKGLGMALDKPLVEIPTVDGLAFNLYGTDKLVCPLMDARRDQVYTGIYAFEGDHAMGFKILLEQCAVDIGTIADRLNAMGRPIIFLGDGVPVFSDRLKELMKVPYSIAPAHMNRQRAATIAVLAGRYMQQGEVVTAADHAPIYLRLSQAEREKAAQSPVIIRRMEIDDVAAVSALEAKVFTMPWSADDFLEMIAADYAYYYVAELAGQPIGACGVRYIVGEGQITNVLVAGEHRRKGIALRLMEQMLAEAQSAGITDFVLEVRASNQAAIKLYERLGFEVSGRRPDFYEKPVEDGLIMIKAHG